MAKYSFKIEADSITDLMEKMRQELKVMSEEQEKIAEFETTVSRKVTLYGRKNKPWTEYELNYIRAYYLQKSTAWIAQKLHRHPTAINAQLTRMYKRGLPKRINKSSKAITTSYENS